MIYTGIDGCKTGWFIFSLKENSYSYSVVKSIKEAEKELNLSDINFIDIPLGLENDKPARDCDMLLKKILGKKSSTIFNAPVYPLLKCSTYEEACSLSQKKTGKKISLQTWYIIPKIRDANSFLQKCKNKDLLKEFHPETGFFLLNKKTHLQFSKKDKQGIAERIRILNKYIDAEKIFQEISSETLRKNVAKDDILDAMCCAVNAKFADKTFTVPEISTLDKFGIKKEIVLTKFI